MSWKAENWLAENCDLAFGVPRALLFAMANQANDEGSLMAKNKTYMKRLNVTERSVQRATHDLVKGGWIQKIPDYSEDGRQLCNVYRIVMPPIEGGGRVTPTSPPQGDAHVTLRVTSSVTPRVTTAVTPIKNQTDNPHGEPKTPPTPLPGGAGSTVADQLEAITKRLWAEWQIRLTTRERREAKHRLRAGESADGVFAWLKGPDPTPPWDPPAAHRDASRLWQRVLEVVKESPRISAPSFVTWLCPLEAVGFDQPGDSRAILTLAAPTAEFSRLCQLNYGQLIREFALRLSLDVHFWEPTHKANGRAA